MELVFVTGYDDKVKCLMFPTHLKQKIYKGTRHFYNILTQIENVQAIITHR